MCVCVSVRESEICGWKKKEREGFGFGFGQQIIMTANCRSDICTVLNS